MPLRFPVGDQAESHSARCRLKFVLLPRTPRKARRLPALADSPWSRRNMGDLRRTDGRLSGLRRSLVHVAKHPWRVLAVTVVADDALVLVVERLAAVFAVREYLVGLVFAVESRSAFGTARLRLLIHVANASAANNAGAFHNRWASERCSVVIFVSIDAGFQCVTIRVL